ncbi:sulfatase-like hydrolase/transferase [Fluviispira multicolorata]|uniref:Sulfatase-like hydrolase/transferase n=1 Tax=Fluviispira multicolorata TaxID=2654512 RepID=A0A833JG44_9BACT|nr:sulfatase-like hydrolase/transferase [Fluviispira multicolorata]KAB8032007.1 sulfatase-like hydrolase/transferase [Fluviispira multicolorata]
MISSFSHKISRMSSFKRISIIIALFIMYDIFIIKQPLKFIYDIIGGRYFVNYLLSVITLIFFILFIDLLFKGKFFSKLLAVLLVFIPLGIQTAHYSFYNAPLTAYGIRFFFSEPMLTTQLGFENINYFKTTLFILFSFFIIYLFLPKKKDLIFRKSKMIFYSILYIPLVILCGVNWYLILDYQHSMVSVYAALPETARSLYFKKLKADKPTISLSPTTKKLPNILWIVGESVAKSHMSLYGYQRNTTPNLDKMRDEGILIPFQNVVSIGPHTLISVPYMLVGKQNIDPFGTIYSAPNIFDYAKARNYDTAFISAQDLRWKNFDQLTGNGLVDYYRSGPDFSTNVSVSKGADDIKVLDKSILPHLSEMRSPFLLIAHMDGSHYPYNIHSEKEYKKYFPENSPNGTNAYDNTIVYSDVYLNRLIEAARKKDPDIWIFYTTDHGQNVALAQNKNASHEEKKQDFDSNYKDKNIDNSEAKNNNKDESNSIFSAWTNKIKQVFEEKDKNDDESKVIFNQGYSKDIIHNAFFVIPPDHYLEQIKNQANSPIAQSDIFATILQLMEVVKPVAKIDGLSLLETIPENRFRISTGFVVTNDNVPEAEVFFPDLSSLFVDFSRNSVSISKEKKVIQLSDASQEIQDLFVEKNRKIN